MGAALRSVWCWSDTDWSDRRARLYSYRVGRRPDRSRRCLGLSPRCRNFHPSRLLGLWRARTVGHRPWHHRRNLRHLSLHTLHKHGLKGLERSRGTRLGPWLRLRSPGLENLLHWLRHRLRHRQCRLCACAPWRSRDEDTKLVHGCQSTGLPLKPPEPQTAEPMRKKRSGQKQAFTGAIAAL